MPWVLNLGSAADGSGEAGGGAQQGGAESWVLRSRGLGCHCPLYDLVRSALEPQFPRL